MSFVIAGNSASTGYNLTRSLRFRSSATAWLGRTPATTTNQQTWTFSAWIKRGTISTQQSIFDIASGSAGVPRGGFYFETDNTLNFLFNTSGSAFNVQLITTQVFRDPSAYYHIVFSVDTTQATAANRIKVYLNGTQITAFSTATYPAQNTDFPINSTALHNIGRLANNSSYFDGYLTEVNFIDGQALTPSSFGSINALTGVWQPARYTGSYGTNGFYLPFTDNSALTTSSNVGLGKDFSGNANYWTTNNISITAGVTYDSMTDVPTLTSATAANFAVLNPLNYGQAGTSLVISNGNLQAVSDRTAASNWTQSTITLPTTGKWYCEMIATAGCAVGLLDITTPNQNSVPTKYRTYFGNSGNKISDNGGSVAYGLSFTNTDTIGIAVDMGAGTLVFYKNNSSQGTAYTDISSVGVTWALGCYFTGLTNNTVIVNFGQRPFQYTPPTGFVALNTFNIAAGTVTTSGSFTGNLSANGPFVYLNGVPTAMTINGNAVTFGTHADKLANGFKVRSSSALYNLATSNTYSVTTNGAVTKYANAQGNP